MLAANFFPAAAEAAGRVQAAEAPLDVAALQVYALLLVAAVQAKLSPVADAVVRAAAAFEALRGVAPVRVAAAVVPVAVELFVSRHAAAFDGVAAARAWSVPADVPAAPVFAALRKVAVA